jgi:predicted amidophosphoribosyltransferase
MLKLDTSPRMTTCPACKKELSASASRCPNCGHNLNPFGSLLKGVALLLVVAVCIYVLCNR